MGFYVLRVKKRKGTSKITLLLGYNRVSLYPTSFITQFHCTTILQILSLLKDNTCILIDMYCKTAEKFSI